MKQESNPSPTSVETELQYYKDLYLKALKEKEIAEQKAAEAEHQKQAIENATFWKMTRPLRMACSLFKKNVIKSDFDMNVHPIWWELTSEEHSFQRQYQFKATPTFSIVTPLYNTPLTFLKELIQSLICQTYPHWELCLADASDKKYNTLEKYCQKYMLKDVRIRYKRLQDNYGISQNTNLALAMAQGQYIGLLDHDDLLHPAALWECAKAIEQHSPDLLYTDEAHFDHSPEKAFFPHYKPDFSPDTLRSYNYICHFLVFSQSLLEKTGLFHSEYDGSQDYDLILRMSEHAGYIYHIPKILYFWRVHSKSVADDLAAKPFAADAAKRALQAHLDRLHLTASVEDSSVPSTYRIHYQLSAEPLISIIIPNHNERDSLELCIKSILTKTTYPNFEILIVENNSKQEALFQYYNDLRKYPNIKILTWNHPFNYSAINNYAASFASGEYLVLLNNDIEIISGNWLEEMLMFAQRREVGAVGVKLYYPDNTVQHAGVFLGIGGVAGHGHKYFPRTDRGYMFRLTIAQNVSAVTAACVMIPTFIFHELEGLDEEFQIAYNDIDLCLRIRERGYLIIFTPYAEAYHFESKSRGTDSAPEKQKRVRSEIARFYAKWYPILKKGDPYYNPNLTLDAENFQPK